MHMLTYCLAQAGGMEGSVPATDGSRAGPPVPPDGPAEPSQPANADSARLLQLPDQECGQVMHTASPQLTCAIHTWVPGDLAKDGAATFQGLPEVVHDKPRGRSVMCHILSVLMLT